ncbi:MAG: putative lipoprotein [Methylomonas sp.]|nr:putative lipoprotein [Methylomonas sp.]
MKPDKTLSTLAVAILTAATLSACSFSTSSESSASSSDSSKSAFDLASSPMSLASDSSTSEQDPFENDVADYTKEFATSPTGTLDQFRAHLGEIAQDHGITDWENDIDTYDGIGRGLKKAKLNKKVVSDFVESISGNDAMKKKAIEDGLK